jgi:hypothetical protein
MNNAVIYSGNHPPTHTLAHTQPKAQSKARLWLHIGVCIEMKPLMHRFSFVLPPLSGPRREYLCRTHIICESIAFLS